MQTELARWGNSLAIRIPKQALAKAAVKEGDRLEIEIADDGVIRLTVAMPRLTLQGLVDGITKTNVHGQVEWGEPQGKEVW